MDDLNFANIRPFGSSVLGEDIIICNDDSDNVRGRINVDLFVLVEQILTHI